MRTHEPSSFSPAVQTSSIYLVEIIGYVLTVTRRRVRPFNQCSVHSDVQNLINFFI